MVDTCIICFDDITEKYIKCSQCSFRSHISCWNSLLKYQEKIKHGANCPICKLWIPECPFIITRSMTHKSRCQEKERKLRHYLLSMHYIQDDELRMTIIDKLFKTFMEASHMRERKELMNIIRGTLKRLFHDGWKGAEYFYYQLYAERI